MVNAGRITYFQVANATSLKEFKNIKITSYKASNGEEFSVGEVVTSGSAFFTEVPINVTNPDGLTAERVRIYVGNSEQQGLQVGMQLRLPIEKLPAPTLATRQPSDDKPP